jgi:hypothetical protein
MKWTRLLPALALLMFVTPAFAKGFNGAVKSTGAKIKVGGVKTGVKVKGGVNKGKVKLKLK